MTTTLLFLSRCAVGYAKNPETYECDDVNECDTGDANCDINSQACLNTIGSFKCLDILESTKVTECGEGFRYQARLEQCVGKFESFHSFSMKAAAVLEKRFRFHSQAQHFLLSHFHLQFIYFSAFSSAQTIGQRMIQSG